MARAEPGPAAGLLLANLGTPASPEVADVRAFLEEFLCDPAVVRLPRWFWPPLLRNVILPRRAPKSAAAYRSIWLSEGSPLAVNTQRLARAVETELGTAWRVEVGMRYGRPSLADAFDTLRARGATHTWVLPLYPQASGTTTGTTFGALERARQLALPWRALEIEADDAGYVEALAQRVEALGPARAGARLVISFHGLPQSYVRAGDRYAEHCERTAHALTRRLGLGPEQWILTYQSRFGPGRWLGPATREVVLAAARRGERSVILPPGFAADCLETLEELGLALAHEVAETGGPAPILIAALNDHPRWVLTVADRARAAEAQGW